MNETVRLVDVDRELGRLTRVRRNLFEAGIPTITAIDSNMLAIDFWLDQRLAIVAPFRNYSAPVIPGR